jgi:hypothetical protein
MIDSFLELLFLAVFPFLKRRRQRGEEWTGFLEEIRKRRNPLAESPRLAVFRTDEGRKVTVLLSERDSTRYEKGIRYRKKAGEDFPAPFA